MNQNRIDSSIIIIFYAVCLSPLPAPVIQIICSISTKQKKCVNPKIVCFLRQMPPSGFLQLSPLLILPRKLLAVADGQGSPTCLSCTGLVPVAFSCVVTTTVTSASKMVTDVPTFPPKERSNDTALRAVRTRESSVLTAP